MADPTSATHLYSSVTHLAYAEQQLALQPKVPFFYNDRQMLTQQSTDVANCAAGFRIKNSSNMNQTNLFASQGLVDTAQTMLQMINQQMTSGTLTKVQVLAQVTAAVTAVNAL